MLLHVHMTVYGCIWIWIWIWICIWMHDFKGHHAVHFSYFNIYLYCLDRKLCILNTHELHYLHKCIRMNTKKTAISTKKRISGELWTGYYRKKLTGICSDTFRAYHKQAKCDIELKQKDSSSQFSL